MALLLILLAAPLWAVDLIFLAEVTLGIAPLRQRAGRGASPRIAILTPAHNEASVVGPTVQALAAILPPGVRHLVVAHNCNDATAAEARAAGAEVAVLNQPDRRGKGYALAFGREQLAADPPEVVIVVDADCTLDPGTVERLAHAAIARNRAVQGCYLFRSRPSDAPVVQISNFAMLVKNLIRQRGGARLGASAPLAGSGMAFPWAQFAALDLATGNIVEDLAIGIELVQAGFSPAFEERARTWSTPSSAGGTETQRARWEGGFMATARTMAMPLVRQGLMRRSWPLFWIGLHVLVPPLTLLLMGNAAVLLLFGLLPLVGVSAVPFGIQAALFGALTLSVLAAWVVAGRQVLPFRMLVRLPLYLLWKVALYTRLARRQQQAAWVRTERVD
ncbi:glycosyltransferase family 2 protein [uncultured Sphingomonas sp.]|uniref:glycosyltransferase family 2 protein n=1 Tax=uncultured Sphingomonas sp. TaxID=158754 RepID=UPI0025D65884|nr:glycosyltransferase family 2 protein [uncultured Sphingomonas sp.]